jgi:flavin reductase (DIM6/NTAB) family NADH-FMN oxidoreductase RutF
LKNLQYREEVTGAPIIMGVLSFLDCRVEATYQGGNHDIFLGKVEKFGLGDEKDPLLFFRGKYRSLR